MIRLQQLQDRIHWKFLILAILKLWFPLPQGGVPQFPFVAEACGLRWFVLHVHSSYSDARYCLCLQHRSMGAESLHGQEIPTGYITVPSTIG